MCLDSRVKITVLDPEQRVPIMAHLVQVAEAESNAAAVKEVRDVLLKHGILSTRFNKKVIAAARLADVYTDNLGELLAICLMATDDSITGALSGVLLTAPYIPSASSVCIPDELWCHAVAILCIARDPELIKGSTTEIKSFIVNNLQEIASLLFFMVDRGVDSQKVSLLQKEIEDLQHKYKIQTLLLEGEDKLRAKLTQLREECVSLRTRCRQLEKRNTAELYNIEKPLLDRITKQHAEIEKLRARLEPAVSESLEPAVSESLEPAVSESLPETGIVCVGGHPNLLKKLRNVYPKWVYHADSCTYDIGDNNSAVVCFYTHMSHKSYYRLRTQCDMDSIIFVNSTNIESVLRSIASQMNRVK